MKEDRLSPEALVMVLGSSKGKQPKYYENGYWYKVNNVGYENIAEHLVSKVLKHSNVKNYVDYELCAVNGRPGCRSKNFLMPDESFLSFQRLYELYTGEGLQEKMLTISDTAGRIDLVKDFVAEYTGFDCSAYLSQILTLDALTLNTDRHFNNLGLIVNGRTGEYREAPIFDNGNALLSDWEKFSEETIEENLERVYGQPFSSSLGMQAKLAGFGLALDYQALYQDLAQEPDSRGLQVLKYQMEHMRSMIPDISEIHLSEQQRQADALGQEICRRGICVNYHSDVHENHVDLSLYTNEQQSEILRIDMDTHEIRFETGDKEIDYLACALHYPALKTCFTCAKELLKEYGRKEILVNRDEQKDLGR